MLVCPIHAISGNTTTHPSKKICKGESITLTTDAVGDSYLWNTGETTNSITVTPSKSTQYTCIIKTDGSTQDTGNLISLGGFEFAPNQVNSNKSATNNIGATVSYEYMNFDQSGKNIAIGAVTTAKNANDVKDPYFVQLAPHSGDYMLVCDGGNSSSARVWQARNLVTGAMPLKAGITYEFSCWVANIDAEYSKHGSACLAKLKFVIEYDGSGGEKELLSFTAPEQLGVWKQQRATFTPTNNSSWCNIWILNYTTVDEGNDFALDDIYFGTVISEEGSETTEIFPIEVSEAPTVAITNTDQNVCAGESTELTATIAGDYTSISWKKGNTELPAFAGKSKIEISANTQKGTQDTYTISVKSDVCPSAEAQATITSIDCSPEPVIIDHPEIKVCIGECINLTAETAGDSYLWSTGETSHSITVSPADESSIQYSCTVTTVSGNLTITTIENFSVKGIDCSPKIINLEVCAGESIKLNDGDLSEYIELEWASDNDPSLEYLSDINIVSPYLNAPDQEGLFVYTFKGKDTTTGENDYTTTNKIFNITVKDCYPPADNVNHDPIELCIGESVKLVPQYSGYDKYEWSDGSNYETSQITAVAGETTYECTIYDTKGHVVAYETFSVIGKECPIELSTQKTNNTVCEPDDDNPCNGSANVQATGGVAPYSYLWSNGADTPIADNLCTGTYTVIVTDAVGTEATASVEIITEGTIIIDEGEVTLCPGSSYEFHGETFTQEGEISVTVQNEKECDIMYVKKLNFFTPQDEHITETICEGSEYDFYGQVLTESGEYEIVHADENGCDITSYLKLTVISFDGTEINGDSDICIGENAIIKINGAPEGCAYAWKGYDADGRSSSSILVSPNESNTYEYESTISYMGCETTMQWQLNAHEIPSIITEITGEDPYRNVEIKAVGGGSPYTFVFDNMTNNDGIFNNVSSGYHQISLIDNYGCASDTTIMISLPLVPDKFFTPNGDGTNDFWTIKNIESEPSYIYIFDRFDRKVAEFNPGEFHGWDGNYNGHQMPTADYWYLIRSASTGESINGHFTLFRGK